MRLLVAVFLLFLGADCARAQYYYRQYPGYPPVSHSVYPGYLPGSYAGRLNPIVEVSEYGNTRVISAIDPVTGLWVRKTYGPDWRPEPRPVYVRPALIQPVQNVTNVTNITINKTTIVIINEAPIKQPPDYTVPTPYGLQRR